MKQGMQKLCQNLKDYVLSIFWDYEVRNLQYNSESDITDGELPYIVSIILLCIFEYFLRIIIVCYSSYVLIL